MSPVERPSVVVIAGPNGAGKSTIAPSVLRGALQVPEFVNADVIARGLSGFDPESVAVTAGRIMLERLHALAGQRLSFAFETTLASRSFVPWIRGLIAKGYVFHCVYVWLATPELALERVADRVRRGGHHVPARVVRRRYEAGVENFFALYQPMANTWQVYDNSGSDLKLVALGSRAEILRIQDRTRWEAISGRALGPMWQEARMLASELDRIGRVMLDTTAVEEAARRAVREAILAHKREGLPIVIERAGKIVWISADEALGEATGLDAGVNAGGDAR